MSQRGDGGIQPDRALALGDKETQEHAKCVGTILSRPPSAGTVLLQNKRSQSVCIKSAWFLSKPPKQLANVNAVVVEGHITSTPLLAHPLTERRQQSGIASRGLGRPQGNDPAASYACSVGSGIDSNGGRIAQEMTRSTYTLAGRGDGPNRRSVPPLEDVCAQ